MLLLFSIILIVGYIRYNPQLKYEDKIPASAETILHVNLRKIEYGFVKNYLKHPTLFFKDVFGTKKGRKNKKDSLKGSKTPSNETKKGEKTPFYKTISLPPNTFFYTNTKEFKGAFISSFFKVKNKLGLETFFKDKKYTKKKKEDITIYEKGSYAFAIHKNNLIIVYKEKLVNITKLAENVFSNTHFLKKENVLLKKMEKSSSELTLASLRNDFLELDISDKSMRISGSFRNDFDLFLPHKAEVPQKKGIINISGKLNTKLLSEKIQQKQKDKFKKLTTLSVDSVMKKWNGDFQFNVSSFSTKIDTIVTYEYDDDFNKVEKKAIKKRKIPSLILKTSNSSLVNYLKEKEAVKKVEGEEVVAIIPFFKVLLHSTNQNLFFYTEKQKEKMVTQEEKFLFSFCVERYMKEGDEFYLKKNKYLNTIKDVKAAVSTENHLQLTINFKKTIPDFILQLVRE